VDDATEPVEATLVDPIEDYRPPRLSLLHLLIWTTAAAVSLALLRTRFESAVGTSTSLAGLIALVALVSTGITSVCIFAIEQRRGNGFPVRPGEWYLLAIGIARMAEVLVIATASLLGVSAYSFSQCVVSIALTLSLATAALRCRASRAWSLWFWSLLLLHTPDVVYFAMELAGDAMTVGLLAPCVQIPVGLTTCVTFVVAILLDTTEKRRGGWIHWTGVAFAVGGAVFWVQTLLHVPVFF
jgi:hypothetical protein